LGVWLLPRRGGPFTVSQAILYWIASMLARLQWGTRWENLPKLPEGGAVIVGNHRSSIDPLFFQMAVRRPIHWMVAVGVKQENAAVRWLLRTIESIPVRRRGGDQSAVMRAIQLVRDGKLVGIFPEGRVNVDEKFMMPVRPGAILVASRAKAPLIPCYVEGSPFKGTMLSPLLMTANVLIRWGEPVYLFDSDEKPNLPDCLVEICREVAKLSGNEDFEPTLAGKRWFRDLND